MNEKKRHENKSIQPHPLPAYPYRADQILQKLRSALQNHLHQSMTFERLAEISGQKLTTTHYRWTQSLKPHLIVLMRLLERLPQTKRDALLSGFCRPLPSLEHARLAHSMENLASLLETLRQPNGLTVVTGGTDSERAFVLGALGHDYPRLDPQRRCVAGLDLHCSKEFVPVQTLIYADSSNRTAITQAWPRLENSGAPMILLNKVWSAAREIRPGVITWARHRHVVLAEDSSFRDYLLVPKTLLRFLFLSSDKTVLGRIHVNQELRG